MIFQAKETEWCSIRGVISFFWCFTGWNEQNHATSIAKVNSTERKNHELTWKIIQFAQYKLGNQANSSIPKSTKYPKYWRIGQVVWDVREWKHAIKCAKITAEHPNKLSNASNFCSWNHYRRVWWVKVTNVYRSFKKITVVSNWVKQAISRLICTMNSKTRI